jgi:hypothetical protein
MPGKGDVGADEPGDKMLKVMCHSFKELLGKLGRGMRNAVVHQMGNENGCGGLWFGFKDGQFFFFFNQ